VPDTPGFDQHECPAENVGRNKLAQFRQPYGKRTVAMPELRKLVPAYDVWIAGLPVAGDS